MTVFNSAQVSTSPSALLEQILEQNLFARRHAMLSNTITINNFDLNQFCQQFVMTDKANSLLAIHNNLNTFLDDLIKGECYSDAILFIIYRLTQKQAIQWACNNIHH